MVFKAHKKNTQGEKAPSQGKLAGPTEPHQTGYSESPASLQGGTSPAPPPPRPALPSPAQLSRGDASTEPPLPPAIIRGASAPPRCRGQLSTPLYIILLYRRAVLPSYGSRKRGQDTIWGGPCLPPTITLSPSSWTLDPHGRGAHSGPGTWKSVAPARSMGHPRDLPLCGLHPEPCTRPQGE